MNNTYKPIQTSVPIRGRVIVFWTSTLDEATTKARPNSGGIWSPNHFVPLVEPNMYLQTSPTEQSTAIIDVN